MQYPPRTSHSQEAFLAHLSCFPKGLHSHSLSRNYSKVSVCYSFHPKGRSRCLGILLHPPKSILFSACFWLSQEVRIHGHKPYYQHNAFQIRWPSPHTFQSRPDSRPADHTTLHVESQLPTTGESLLMPPLGWPSVPRRQPPHSSSFSEGQTAIIPTETPDMYNE